jgi:hypothetical protein
VLRRCWGGGGRREAGGRHEELTLYKSVSRMLNGISICSTGRPNVSTSVAAEVIVKLSGVEEMKNEG